MNIITLTTDFGLGNTYISQMKGIIYTIAPQACCIDITHLIPPHQIKIGAFLLSSTVNVFPKGTIHVAVVDPGVGTKRRGIVIVSKKYVFIGPDNGLLFNAAYKQGIFEVFEITNENLYNDTISQTFHGRDIFAPVAAHILMGVPFTDIGPIIHDYKTFFLPKEKINEYIVEVEVMFIDDFGNIITNFQDIIFHSMLGSKSQCKISIKGEIKQIPYFSSYGYASLNQMLVTIGSFGFVELAINQGNASKMLGLSIGDKIIFDFS
jgi:S-adenosylmethionine hydrolase